MKITSALVLILILSSIAVIVSAQKTTINKDVKIGKVKENKDHNQIASLNQVSNSQRKVDSAILSQPEEEVSVIVEVNDEEPLLDTLAVSGTKEIGDNFKSLKISKNDLTQLENSGNVKKVYLNNKNELFMDLAGPIVGSDVVNSEGYDGNGINVCVLDTGINYNHTGLFPRVIASKDFVTNDSDGNDTNDFFGHGTHVAGIIASSFPGLVGIAPGASIINAKVFENDGTPFPGAYDDVVAEGIEWCMEQGANVLSMSFGFNAVPNDGSDWLSQQIDSAVDQGVIAVVAGGNEGPDPNTIACPGCAHNVITVGATYKQNYGLKNWPTCSDPNALANDLVCFSSVGPTADFRTKPDVVAPGAIITSLSNQGGFANESGTSMSAPMVAGMAALLLQNRPSLTPEEMKALIMNSVYDYGEFIKDDYLGTGRIDVSTAIDEINFTVRNDISTSNQIYFVNVTHNDIELRALLYWPENYDVHNNLDLYFIDPLGNEINVSDSVDDTDEMLKVNDPMEGYWAIGVRPISVLSQQRYAIAANLQLYDEVPLPTYNVTIISPQNNSILNTNLINLEIISNETVQSMSVFLDVNFVSSCSDCDSHLELLPVSEGSHNLTVTITNFIFSENKTINFNVDSIAPNITITNPTNGQTLTTTSTLFDLTTNENSNCLYSYGKCSENGCNLSAYSLMTTTGLLSHSQLISNLNNTQTNEHYNLSANCSDNLNSNFDSVSIFVDTCNTNWTEVISNCGSNNLINITYNDTNGCYALTGVNSDNIPPPNRTTACDYNSMFAPVLNQISDVSVAETFNVTLTANATDPNNDPLTNNINDSRFTQTNNQFTWQTTLNDEGTYVVRINVTDGTFTDSQNVTVTITHTADDDNDGIADYMDKVIGNGSITSNTFSSLVVKIDGSTNLNQNFTGIKSVEILNNSDILVQFNFNFDSNQLNLINVDIEKQTGTSAGSLLVRNLNLPSGTTKTVYVENVNGLRTICIEDADISSISSVSSLCNSANEFGIKCSSSGTTTGSYRCTTQSGKYMVEGLSHSGVKEQAYCGDGDANSGETCSNCPSDAGACSSSGSPSSGGSSGGGGGGGGGGGTSFVCNQDWLCAEWTSCTNGKQTRSCNFVKVAQHTQSAPCPTTSSAPSLSKSCVDTTTINANKSLTLASIETQINETNDQQATQLSSLDSVTGAVVGNEEQTPKTSRKGETIFLMIGILVICGYFVAYKTGVMKKSRKLNEVMLKYHRKRADSLLHKGAYQKAHHHYVKSREYEEFVKR